MRTSLSTAAILAAFTLASPLALAETEKSFQGSAKDAWITGKVETVYTLNPHLSPFRINTDVENGAVRLTGTVESDIDRDLAGELAKGVTGVTEVRNDLQVDTKVRMASTESESAGRRDFGSWVDDATTTAAVKSKLIHNAHTKGLKIDVDTSDDVVTLTGRVKTSEERDLAIEIAQNTGDVKEVRSNLVVDAS